MSPQPESERPRSLAQPQPQTVWIIGARTLGRALAMHFSATGWRVVVGSRTQADVDAVADAVTQQGGQARAVVCDLNQPATLRAVVASEPRIDMCIAAQTAGGRFGALPLVEVPPEELQRGFEGYLSATFNLLQAVGPHMLARGSGTFVQVGTSSGVRTKAGYAALGAVQHGLKALLQVAAKEWRQSGVHVAYLPIDGAIQSDRTEAWIEKNGVARAIPQSSIAEACAYLHQQHPRGWTHELVLRPPGTEWTAPT